MELLKKMFFKVWFDKKTGLPIGFNSRTNCVNCKIRKQLGVDINACPPPVQQLVVADLDRELNQIIGKPKSVVECEAEVLIREKKK